MLFAKKLGPHLRGGLLMTGRSKYSRKRFMALLERVASVHLLRVTTFERDHRDGH